MNAIRILAIAAFVAALARCNFAAADAEIDTSGAMASAHQWLSVARC